VFAYARAEPPSSATRSQAISKASEACIESFNAISRGLERRRLPCANPPAQMQPPRAAAGQRPTCDKEDLVATVDWLGTRAPGATSVPADRQLARARGGRFIRADIARAKKITSASCLTCALAHSRSLSTAGRALRVG